MSAEPSGTSEFSEHSGPRASPGTHQVALPEGALHEYDGIFEQDNDLPQWWLAILFLSIIFAGGYWFHYQVFKSGRSAEQNYQDEMASVYAEEAARARAAGRVTDESLVALSRDRTTTARGAQLFAANCVACHRADGGGNIGPNLTDAFWINGSAPTRIFRTVNEGVTAKGMPAWGGPLGMDGAQSVTAYVLSLRNTNIAGGKAPQGQREE